MRNKLTNKLKDIFKDELGVSVSIKDIVKLHGDASYRTYYRAHLVDGKSYIVMELPQGKSSASEEITNYKGDIKEYLFVNIAKTLKQNNINVPEVYYYKQDDPILILEDLGDNLVFNDADKALEEKRVELYKQAIDIIVDLQNLDKEKNNNCIAFQRSFDQTLLNWEFDHFLEYGINVRLNKNLSNKDKELFLKTTRDITNRICKQNYSFTHRDFQSRNIIILNNKFYLIDFQDALLGPKVYDLVSLLRDSYIKLENSSVEELIKYYCGKVGRNYDEVRKEFDLITCQRKLKDAGRFVYIDKVKGNPNYLKNIPTSLGYVKNALENLPEYKDFYNMLSKNTPEL